MDAFGGDERNLKCTLLVSYCPFGLQGPLRASVPIILYSEYFELGLSETESLSVELAMIITS